MVYDTGYNGDDEDDYDLMKQVGMKITVICPFCGFVYHRKFLGNVTFKQATEYTCICQKKIVFGFDSIIEP